jgi:hypothetical protein
VAGAHVFVKQMKSMWIVMMQNSVLKGVAGAWNT